MTKVRKQTDDFFAVRLPADLLRLREFLAGREFNSAGITRRDKFNKRYITLKFSDGDKVENRGIIWFSDMLPESSVRDVVTAHLIALNNN